jgi:hypothetical protein
LRDSLGKIVRFCHRMIYRVGKIYILTSSSWRLRRPSDRRISAFLSIMTLYCFDKKNIIYFCRIIDFATPLSISIHISSTKSFNYYQLFLGCESKFQLPFCMPLVTQNQENLKPQSSLNKMDSKWKIPEVTNLMSFYSLRKSSNFLDSSDINYILPRYTCFQSSL